MKKILSLILGCALAVTAYAIPARPGFRTVLQADGSTIEVQKMGDEHYHYLINREGQEVKLNAEGMYEVVGEAPTVAKVQARRAQARRARKEVGVAPNLAPRGVVILVNFSDKSMNSNHKNATFTELCNSENCTVNSGYPSAREYFKSQSNGAYEPVFDVYGPVKLSKSYSYYGNNVGYGDDAQDEFATDAAIEACILANNTYPDLNFADYDSDNDGKVDFVYIIYAGYGEADYDDESTIWPHNWSIQELVANDQYYPDYTKYRKSQTKLDGVYIDNYAMSNELDGQSSDLCGIGTLCHEFGHVIGLPDFYDTQYSTNYKNKLTPNEWDVMDGGAYNGDGHCPPNYSAWEKYFMGWITPVNLGSQGAKLTLYPNGTAQHNVYQINTSGKLEASTKEGLNYYIECRQRTGWDSKLPAAGMLIWKVNFSASAWTENTPNNTANNPKYTLVIPSGTMIGADYGNKNVWPYSTYKSWTDVTGKPLKDITRNGDNITLIYIEEPVIPVDPFDITYMANGEEFATVNTTTGKVVLPATEPESCTNGKEFVGWCSQADYESETTAPAFVNAGDDSQEGAVYYAVYANKEEGGAPQTTTYTFTSKAWVDATSSWTSNKEGYRYESSAVQVISDTSGAGAEMKDVSSDVTKVVVSYFTNATKGAGSIKISVGNTSQSKDVTKTGGRTSRNLEYTFNKASGKVAFEVSCTTSSIYIQSVSITAGSGASYKNYTTSCSGEETGVEQTNIAPTAVKAIRDGQLVIIRGNAVYSVTGARVQ